MGEKFKNNKKDFLDLSKQSATESEKKLTSVYQKSTIRFSEPKKEHEDILKKVKEINNEKVFFYY